MSDSSGASKLQLVKRILTWVVGLVALGFCIYAVIGYWGDFKAKARDEISLGLLALGVLCILASYLSQAVGWMLLMSGLGNRLRLYTALRAWCYSQVGKYVPGKVVAFLVRARAAEDEGALPSKVFATCVLEIMVGLVAAFCIWLFSLAVSPGATPLPENLRYVCLIPLPFALVSLHPRVINWVMGRYYRWRKMPESEMPRLTLPSMLKAGAAYFVAWTLYGIGGYFVLTSVVSLESGGLATAVGVTGAFVFSWAVGYVVLISPGGLGFREGALAFALQAWVPGKPVFVVAALARLCQSGTELALAGGFWVVHRFRRSPALARSLPYVLVLGVLVVVGTVLRFFDLSGESLWRDECISVWLAKQPIWEVLKNRAEHSHAPLYFLMLKPWVWIFGDSEAAVRAFSAACGVASIGMIYLVAVQLFNERRIGMIAAALLAFSPLHVEYSQETRMYAPAVLATLVSMYWFFRLVKEQTRRNRIGYLVSTIVLVYVHNSGWFVVAAQNLAMLYRHYVNGEREFGLKAWGKVQLVVLLAFLPWIAMLTAEEGWKPGSKKARIKYLLIPIVTYAGSPGLLVAYVLAVLGALPVLKQLRDGDQARGPFAARLVAAAKRLRVTTDWRVASLAAWGLVPVLTLFLLTWAVAMKNEPRYTIIAIGGLYILAAQGIARLPGTALPVAAVAVFAWLSVAPLSGYYEHQTKAQWREAVACVETLAEPGDKVFVDCSYPKRDKKCSYDYYAWRKDLDVSGFLRKKRFIKGKHRKMPKHQVTKHPRFWLLWLDGPSYRPHVRWLKAVGYREKYFKHFLCLNVQLLERPTDKPVVLPPYESVFEDEPVSK